MWLPITIEQGGGEGRLEHKAAEYLNLGALWLQNGFAANRWQTPEGQTNETGLPVGRNTTFLILNYSSLGTVLTCDASVLSLRGSKSVVVQLRDPGA